MDFGKAIEALKAGKKVARAGWNGKGMFVFSKEPRGLHPTELPHDVANSIIGNRLLDHGDSCTTLNRHMLIKGVDGNLNTWFPSVSDCFAEDWCIIDRCSGCDACPPTDIVPPCGAGREGFES